MLIQSYASVKAKAEIGAHITVKLFERFIVLDLMPPFDPVIRLRFVKLNALPLL